ncbi:hypothetical protein ACU4GR_24345 [Methylobacterium oryzae CBMB20]
MADEIREALRLFRDTGRSGDLSEQGAAVSRFLEGRRVSDRAGLPGRRRRARKPAPSTAPCPGTSEAVDPGLRGAAPGWRRPT